MTIINTYADCIFIIFQYIFFISLFYLFFLSFEMLLSYDMNWEALYEKKNENKGILILRSILLLFLSLFVELYNFVDPSLL